MRWCTVISILPCYYQPRVDSTHSVLYPHIPYHCLSPCVISTLLCYFLSPCVIPTHSMSFPSFQYHSLASRVISSYPVLFPPIPRHSFSSRLISTFPCHSLSPRVISTLLCYFLSPRVIPTNSMSCPSIPCHSLASRVIPTHPASYLCIPCYFHPPVLFPLIPSYSHPFPHSLSSCVISTHSVLFQPSRVISTHPVCYFHPPRVISIRPVLSLPPAVLFPLILRYFHLICVGGTIALTIFCSQFQFVWNFVLLSTQFYQSGRYKILLMSRQQNCRGMCNNL